MVTRAIRDRDFVDKLLQILRTVTTLFAVMHDVYFFLSYFDAYERIPMDGEITKRKSFDVGFEESVLLYLEVLYSDIFIVLLGYFQIFRNHDRRRQKFFRSFLIMCLC